MNEPAGQGRGGDWFPGSLLSAVFGWRRQGQEKPGQADVAVHVALDAGGHFASVLPS